MKKECVNPQTLFDPTPYGFSQVVVSKPGKNVFVSGQVACDKNFKLVGENDLKVQTQQAVENLKLALEGAGATLSDVVMLRVYKVNYKEEDGYTINKVLGKYFGSEHLPASTWLSVDGLVEDGFMIEIEAQAVI